MATHLDLLNTDLNLCLESLPTGGTVGYEWIVGHYLQR